MGTEEWAGATSVSVDFGGHPATVRFMHDSQYLYMAATVTDNSAPVGASFTAFFDGNHNGAADPGEDAVLAKLGSASSQGSNDLFWSPTSLDCCANGATWYPDTYDGGTADVLGAGTSNKSSTTFEIRHPLCSSDTGHDVCIPPSGGTIGIELRYGGEGSSGRFYPGTSDTDASSWANLVIPAYTPPPPSPPTITSKSISVSAPDSSIAGASSVKISDIPPAVIRGGSIDSSPLGGIPLGGIPLGGIPLGGIPLGGIPLGGIPLGGIPLGGIPLGGIGFTADELNQNGLGGVPLSEIPLNPPDSWDKHLVGTPFEGAPLQSVTLAQILNTSAVDGVSLADLDIADSPLAGIPLAGIALGGIPLGGIAIGGDASASTDQILSDWCDYINQQPGFEGSCSDPSSLSGQTVIGLALEGVPLGGIPLGGIPLGGIPLGGIPLDAKNTILNCPTGDFTCPDSATLADAAAAGAIKDTATIEDIGYYLDANGTPITLAELVQGLPPSTTLADLIGTILSVAAYDWEALPLGTFPVQDFSSDGGVITYRLTYELDGTGADTAGATLKATLPDGAIYVPGSTTSSSGDGGAPPSAGEPSLNGAHQLVWNVTGVKLGTSETLTYQVRAPMTLGTDTVSATIDAGNAGSADAPQPATTKITQTQAPNSDPSTAPIIASNRLYFGYTPNGDDRDYFRLPAPAPGTKVTIHLSHLKLDNDLAVFGQAPPPLRDPKPGASLPTVPDVPYSLDPNQQITPDVQTDVPQSVPGQDLLGVSDNRGTADETVTVGTGEGMEGYLTIQVTSYDGAYSNDPWMLRVEETPPLPLPPGCTQPGGPGDGIAEATPAIPGNAKTLYLINAKRFGDIYGATAEQNVMAKLQTLAGRSDAAGGAVVPVENDPAVSSAYADWTSGDNYCSPSKANDVVRAIGRLLDRIQPPTVKYIVIVGDDAVIPQGRVLDNTSFANERGYASTFYGTSNNEYLSTYALGFLPTDDPYGDTNYSGSGPYVPEVSVGRLVETPVDILAQLDQYLNRDGTVTPDRSVVTGYDFLSDGAQGIASSLQNDLGGGASQTQLISESWTRSDLLDALFPGSNSEIDSLNAHFDHHRALPAAQNAAGTENDLFTTADVSSRGADALSGRIAMTMGCHSGVSVADGVVVDSLAPDWAQTWAGGGGIDWMGNTGYGLGETAGVAYSEQLHNLLAQRLDGSMTVGQALMYAKQAYTAKPSLDGYDLKVIDELTMYGLPMYRLGLSGSTSGGGPQRASDPTDPFTGLASASFSISPHFSRIDTSRGSYYTAEDGASFVNRRPVEPVTGVDVTQPNLVAHGALITGLSSSDQGNFDPVFSRVVEDNSDFSPELDGRASFPSSLQSIATYAAPDGQTQRLELYAGQFRSNPTGDPGIGVQRLFDHLSGTVLYTPASVTDYSAPTFGPVQVTSAQGVVGFSVDVTDPEGASDVKRVFALYKDGSGTWKQIEFSHVGSLWSGAGSVSGDSVEWFIQAADAAGNVGVTSNKATVESLTPPAPTGTISPSLSGQQDSSGWYTGPVTVTLDPGDGVIASYSIDGAPFQTYSGPFQVTGTGVHDVEYHATDGSSGSLSIPIDVTAPEVIYSSPVVLKVGQTNFDFFACADAGSGVASCTAGLIDTSTATAEGTTRSVTVTATDRVGNTRTVSIDYTVEKLDQTITFGALSDKTYGDPDFTVSATASSGLPVSFSASGNCTVSGTTVHITGAGSCTITASQAGDSNYNGAPSVSRTFSIAKKALTITAKDRTKVYGVALNLGTTAFTASGLVGSDTVTGVTLASDGAAAAAPVGTYAIVPSNAVGTGLANYTITYVNGKLTVYLSAFVGLDSVSISSTSAKVDSYDGSAGAYSSTSAGRDSQVLSNGSISIGGAKVYGSVRSTQGSITLAKDSLITGDVYAGTTFTNNGGTVQGTVNANQPVTKISAPLPAACSPYSATSGLSGGTFAYSSSTGDLSLSKGTATIAPGTYCFHSVTLSGGSILKVTAATVLKLNGVFNTSGGSVSNSTNLAANLKVSTSYTGSSGVSVSGGTSTYFSIYAPGTDIVIKGGSPVFGAMLGKTFTSSGNSAHHYDTSLVTVWGSFFGL